MTVEEYLAFDRASGEIRYEYHDGLVWEVDDPRRFPPRGPARRATAAEYFAGERKGIRHEYIRGEVFRLAETSPEHDRVLTNVVAAVERQLADTPFRTMVRPRIDFDGMITYPDLAIFPEQLVPSPLDAETWSNPLAIY
jgi:hypothetical protein